MRNKAHLVLAKTPAPPHLGSEGFVNSLIESALRDAGYELAGHYLVTHQTRPQDRFLPCEHLRVARSIDRAGRADLAVFDDFGLLSHQPDRRIAEKTLLFFHGLAGGAAVWTGAARAGIDLFCANSPYLAAVVRATLAAADFAERGAIDARAFTAVTHARLPLPDTELAASDDLLPPRVLEALESGHVLGHAVQPGKLNLEALCAIMILLNGIATRSGQARCRLCVHEHDFVAVKSMLQHAPGSHPAREAFAAALGDLGMGLDDIFVPVPWLDRPVLARLMMRCRFALAYNQVPEAFGLYVLESVRLGCPVYTNGAGNLRHSLPPDHGIVVLETAGMAFGELLEYAAVAARIHADLGAPAADAAAACARGATLIAAEHSSGAFAQDIARCLDQLDGKARISEPDLDALVLQLGPLVRAWDAAASRIVSDHRSRVLSPEEAGVLESALGARVADLRTWSGERRTQLEDLFCEGILGAGAVESLVAR